MCCAGLWALGNTAVISSNAGTQWGHCEGHLISGSSESCPWAIPTTWVHTPLIPAPQFAVQIPVSHYRTVKICSVLKFITWQLALGQDRGFGYLQQFAACPRALQEKADLHRKAYFAGAEFTPALWSLPLHDGYLNTRFFSPSKLTEVKNQVSENKWTTILHSITFKPKKLHRLGVNNSQFSV